MTRQSLLREQRSFLLNDAVFYEMLFAFGVSEHDPHDYCVWEHLNHSRMGHARALLWFFERRKFTEDLVSEDFNYDLEEIDIHQDERDRLNKDLFHLSTKRLRHKEPASKCWTDELLEKVHERAILFIDHLLTNNPNREFDVDVPKWTALASALKSGREIRISLRPDSGGYNLEPGDKLPSGKSALTRLVAQKPNSTPSSSPGSVSFRESPPEPAP